MVDWDQLGNELVEGHANGRRFDVYHKRGREVLEIQMNQSKTNRMAVDNFDGLYQGLLGCTHST